MTKEFDVLVVGAGPAGIVAARAAAEHGFRVALFDRKADLSIIDRACAQTLDSPNEYLHHDLYKCNPQYGRLGFPAHGFSVKYLGGFRNVYGTYAYSPNGNSLQFGIREEQIKKGEFGKAIAIVDKEILLKSLLQEAESYGVQVFSGINVNKIIHRNGGVEIIGNQQKYGGRYLIAADGINSNIAEMGGFNVDRKYYGDFRCLQHNVSNLKVPHSDISYGVVGFPPGGPAHLFLYPRNEVDEFSACVVSIHPDVDLKVAWEYFTQKLFCSDWFEDVKIHRTLSAITHNYSPITDPYRDRILVTGDAAATQEIENTGAMIWGWQAGNSIALALNEEDVGLPVTALDDYIQKWQNEHIADHDHDVFMKIWALPFILDIPEEIDYVFGLIKEPLLAGSNPYKARTGSAMHKIMPTIERERPEIIKKMERMSLPASELLAEVIDKTQQKRNNKNI